ncbi:peptidoglycan DD-metalloendopeptidase family protein [Gaetbulibacter sp. NE]|uniref:peptidoglycan DD-metalloendopeptidase family protein n=1 Tax=unclassified Gaetbulibacter TaxID=2625143 RepID=UPI0021D13983|nr:peptidoglycan DD-metalloendopeptidase family protein [Gaetbulibacter sp. NE]
MHFKTLLFAFLFCLANVINAQTVNNPVGGEYVFNTNNLPCLTDVERDNIKSMLHNSVEELRRENKLMFLGNNRAGTHPLFIWPVQKATGASYNDVWGISNYVDQNPSYPDQLTDYNCGTKTYDLSSGYNHQGIDIFTWPFGWKMMDFDEAEIVAAAPGQIIAKGDGEYDRNCGLNNNPWNAVYVQHVDGSVAWYGHMKNGSLTTKNVGEMVVEGEFLGIVGSSGSSTGPHLHFEVYTDNTYTQLVDPYQGACNSLNGDTWWQSQKPYNNPRVNALMTHTSPPIFPACPTQEITNENDDFDTEDTVYFALYLRDQEAGTNVNLKIIKPDDSILYNWDFNLTDSYVASYWYWYYSGIYDMNGAWKWEATYNGETVTHTFNISGVLNVEEETFASTSVYPNPFNDVIIIKSGSKIINADIVDVLGKNIMSIDSISEGITSIDLSQLSNGMYFLIMKNDLSETKTIKLIKK